MGRWQVTSLELSCGFGYVLLNKIMHLLLTLAFQKQACIKYLPCVLGIEDTEINKGDSLEYSELSLFPVAHVSSSVGDHFETLNQPCI